MEFMCYCVGHKLESGKKYLATHKLVPHPSKGNQLTMIITDIEQANDSVTQFKVTDEVKQHLKVFEELNYNTAEQKIAHIARRVRGIIGFEANEQLIQTIDLAFHTVLKYNFGNFKDVRGYLDTLIISESRVGKSSISQGLQDMYGLGTFVSLAGNAATIPGLVGGSNKSATGAYQTRAGIIPQNHNGLIIFEELGKCNSNVIAELTDIRSSNEVRISRVSGTITLPAMVRMISLSNVKSKPGSNIKSISSYPHGISVITELVPTPEDIARYDVILVLGDQGAKQVNPLWVPEPPYTKEQYRARICWIWSRTPDQIVLDDTIKRVIINESNTLNETYGTHIKIFGTETWKKLSRLAITIAGYCVSTDDTYEKIIVKQTHVTAAVRFLKALYDNQTFKLKEYVQHEKLYSTTDDNAIASLQEIYNKSPSLIQVLEQHASVNKNMLNASTGLDNTDLNKQLNRLTKGLFIKMENNEIYPTERFRLTLAALNKNTYVPTIGEPEATTTGGVDDDF